MELLVGGLLFCGAVGTLFVLVRWSARRLFGRPRRLEAELGRDALRHRLEAGEITQSEYDAGIEAIGKG